MSECVSVSVWWSVCAWAWMYEWEWEWVCFSVCVSECVCGVLVSECECVCFSVCLCVRHYAHVCCIHATCSGPMLLPFPQPLRPATYLCDKLRDVPDSLVCSCIELHETQVSWPDGLPTQGCAAKFNRQCFGPEQQRPQQKLGIKTGLSAQCVVCCTGLSAQCIICCTGLPAQCVVCCTYNTCLDKACLFDINSSVTRSSRALQ